MFDYALPIEAAAKKDPKGDKKKPDPPKKKPDDKQPVKTMMIGEKPGDDVGYDPDKIPVEEIPDD